MVGHYGRNYSVISEKSKCSTLRFYATIESWYGGNRFTVVIRERSGNFFMASTVLHSFVCVFCLFFVFVCLFLARPHKIQSREKSTQ